MEGKRFFSVSEDLNNQDQLLVLLRVTFTWILYTLVYINLVFVIIIDPILLSNQRAPVAPGDFEIKSHIRHA